MYLKGIRNGLDFDPKHSIFLQSYRSIGWSDWISDKRFEFAIVFTGDLTSQIFYLENLEIFKCLIKYSLKTK